MNLIPDKKLIIFGFGGHARSAADVAFASGYQDLLFVDHNAAPNEFFLGHPVLESLEGVDESWRFAFPASGDGIKRMKQCDTIAQRDLGLVSLISPMASIGVGSVVAPGCFVGHHSHIGPMANIGRGCIINTGAIVEHDCAVGEYSHISVNSTIAGRSELGAFAMLGAGAIMIDNISVASGTVIGAGSVVTSNVEIAGLYVGVPARMIR